MKIECPEQLKQMSTMDLLFMRKEMKEKTPIEDAEFIRFIDDELRKRDRRSCQKKST